MSFRSIIVALVLTMGAAGCATVEFVPTDDARKLGTVSASDTTWRILMLPIASGDTDDPNSFGCRWFRSTVKLENQMKMVEAEAKRRGARAVTEVSTVTTDEDLLLFVLLREKIHTSATLLK